MLDIAYRCFESCGKPQPLDHGVTIHSLKHWLHPWATLIRMAEPSRAAVVELKRYFDRYSYAQDLEFRTPFVSVFAKKAVDPKLEAELKGLGFGDYQSTIEICVYDEAIEAVLHDDFEIYQARLDEPECQGILHPFRKGPSRQIPSEFTSYWKAQRRHQIRGVFSCFEVAGLLLEDWCFVKASMVLCFLVVYCQSIVIKVYGETYFHLGSS